WCRSRAADAAYCWNHLRGHHRLPGHRFSDAVSSNAQHLLVCGLQDCTRDCGAARFLVRIPLESSAMNWTEYFVPSEHRRLNEFVGLLVLTLGILLALSLVSFNPDDPSFNISQNPQFAARPTNFVGVVGAYGADVFLQTWGYSAFLLPMLFGIYVFYWLASWPVKNFVIRLSGMILMMATIATTLGLSPFRLHDHILPGGLIGKMLADTLRASFNSTRSVVVLVSVFFVSLFLSTKFSFVGAVAFLQPRFRFVSNLAEQWSAWQAERARLIEHTTRECEVEGTVQQIHPRPVVTTFQFKPEPGVKYSRITGLGEDLCLALEAESVRIDRIPGKSTVGIEVPNDDRGTIVLRELLESPDYQHNTYRLPLALGKDITGRIVVSDLQKMPHLLAAGSTGT